MLTSDPGKCNHIDIASLISLIPENIIEHYQQSSPNRTSVIYTLRQVRKQVAEFWLNTPEEQLENTYSSDVGKIHQMLLNSGIKDEPLTDIEQHFVDQLVEHISRAFNEPQDIKYLLAAILYRHAYQLPLQYDFTVIPHWFLVDYLKYRICLPVYFEEIGEIDIYYRYVQQLINSVYASIYSNQDSALWRYVASFIAQNFCFTSLHSTTVNLKDIYTKRAEIIEFVLRANNYQVNYVFPERGKNKKIRLGVFIDNFNPQPEVYNTLPLFEYLDRDKFEIILYAFHVNGHPLEQYCQSRADRLVELPKDLYGQTQTIRADELDIMLIGVGLTDYTHDRTLLALHRLARIQTTYFVSPVTTGMKNIDYFISGKLIEPEQFAQEHYREKLLLLDGSGFCFNFVVESDAPTVKPDRRNIGVASDESVVFVSGASPYKIIPELRETWAKIW
jgi:predicted O-linked N-acetylglucosamine transferase (SPINDLY family)